MKLLKFSQVAEILNCSLSNAYALGESGRLPIVRTGASGRGYRVAEEDLKRFINEGKKGRRIAPFSPKTNPRADSLLRTWAKDE